MNAWHHHLNMAFLDSASSLCCHESVSVRWLSLSWSWPHFAVQSGRATTSLYPQLHCRETTAPSGPGKGTNASWFNSQRSMKNLDLAPLWTLQSMLLASPPVLNAWGTHQRGGLYGRVHMLPPFLIWQPLSSQLLRCQESGLHLSLFSTPEAKSQKRWAVFFVLRPKVEIS